MVARTLDAFASPLAVAAAWLVLGAWTASGWWVDGTPVSVAASGESARLPCLSYAPSRQEGHARDRLTVEQVRRDLTLLARRTNCVRTYTVSEGYDRVPEVARELGMRVLLGLWIGRDATHNKLELATGIRLAREHRDVVRAVIVGNEVLLRHEQTAPQLASMLRRVSAATGLPVTYADVWGYWIRHPELAREVSFVTVHILPYWDDDPVAIDDVIPYVDRLYTKLQRTFPGSTLFVGETGWPTAGRPRGPVTTGRVEQARFLAGFAGLARRRGFDYNVIEAFDQPWKIAHEGTVGGHWGLYDAGGQPKATGGTVVEDARGRPIALAALLAGVVAALGTTRSSRRSRPLAIVHAPGLEAVGAGWSAVARLGLGAFAVAVAARQWRYLVDGNVTAVDWIATLTVVAFGWLALAWAFAARTSGHARADARSAIPRVVELGLLAGAAYVCLGLVFAGRHRDFPVWLFLPGVMALTWVAFADVRARGDDLHTRSANEEATLATWLVLAGMAIPLLEGCANARSIGWGSVCVLLGFAVWLPLAAQVRKDEHRDDDAGTGPREVIEHHAERADDEGGACGPGPAPPRG